MITGPTSLTHGNNPLNQPSPPNKLVQATQALFCGLTPPAIVDPRLDPEPPCQAYKDVVLGGATLGDTGATGATGKCHGTLGPKPANRATSEANGTDLDTIYEQPASRASADLSAVGGSKPEKLTGEA